MKRSAVLFSTLLAAVSLTTTVSATAATKPTFTNGIQVYQSQDGGVYSTTWTAYPMTIESYTGPKLNKPDDLLVALTADGKTSAFRGIIRMSCSSPINSNIVSSENYTSLKDAMANSTIPRPVVNGLFAKFCK